MPGHLYTTPISSHYHPFDYDDPCDTRGKWLFLGNKTGVGGTTTLAKNFSATAHSSMGKRFGESSINIQLSLTKPQIHLAAVECTL